MFIFGLVGLIGSGKGTVGNILHDRFDFIQDSFAKPLKDCVSTIFGWSRNLLEGDTLESRKFREQTDKWWSEKLGYDVTPRMMLQKFGKESVRDNLHEDIWMLALEKRLHPVIPTVITDVRFVNEIEMIHRNGGYIVWVHKNEQPSWFHTAYLQNTGDQSITNSNTMEKLYPEIHRSEWDWIGQKVDFEINNDGTLLELNNSIDELITESYIEDAFRRGIL